MTTLFEDNFDLPTLDSSKWNSNWFGGPGDVTKPVNGAETACYSPGQVSVKRGKLHLRLDAVPTRANNGQTYPQVTGCVTTLNKFSFQDGRLEVRAEIPGDGSGFYNWPAVWTDGLGQWPQTGESDVMEGLGGRASWHYHSPSGAPGGGVVMAGGWHVFAEEVRNGTTTYFYDGVKVGQLACVRAPHFVILGNQSGKYGGKPVFPTDMRVDYVRVTS